MSPTCPTVNLTGWSNETFDVFWYDPRNGGSLVADGQVQGGGFVSLQGAPPDSAQKDWVVYLRNTDLERVPQPDSDPDPDPNPEIDLETSYFLVDTETDTTLMELTGGASVDLDLVDGLSVSLYALTDGASIGEAQLDFNNGQFTAVERFEPYALFGDNSGDFKPGMALSVGSQNLTVTYRAPDGSLLTTETISFVVSETPPDPIDENAAPSAQDDIVTISEDTPITINALGNDSDPDGDALSVSILNGPSNGAAVVQGNGQILYTPDADTFGVDSITYQVTDPDGATGTATVTINVTAENDAPKPTNDNATVLAGKSVLIDVLANDTDVDGDPLFVTEVDGPATIENGQIRVSTAPEARDPITVTYSVSDGTETRTATLNVDVTPASLPDPDPPARTLITAINVGGSAFTASDGTLFEAYTTGVGRAYSSNGPITGTEDETLFQSEKWSNDRSTGLAFDIALEDGDYEIDLFFADIYNGTSRARERVFDVALEGSTVLDDFDLSGTFGARTATIQTFTVEVTDGTLDIDLTHEIENPKLSAFRVWKVGDAAENTPPVANNDFVQLAEDQNAVFDVLTNDTDPDGTDLTITKLSAATHGTVSLLGDGQVSYTPVPDFFGSDSFTYEVTDADGLTSSATVNVTVTPVNDVPIALNDVLKVDENSTATVDVLANDRDLDSDALALIGVTDGANGSASLTADGQITYTPNADFFGIDTVDYTISDGNGGIATGHIAISVTEIPEPEPDPEPEPILDSALEDFFLVDTSSEAVIANLAQRTVIDMGVVDGLSNLNIATFGTNQGKAVESARMSLNDSAWSTVENIVPYALFGDLGGGSDYKSGTFKEGENAVKVAYYTKNNASGSFLGEDELTIVFDEHAKVGTIYEETFLFDTRNMGHETIEYFNEVDTIDFVDLEDDYTAVVDQIDGNTIYFDDDNSLTIIGVDQVNEFMFM